MNLPILSMISGEMAINAVIWLIVVGVIFGLLFWLIGFCALPEPVRKGRPHCAGDCRCHRGYQRPPHPRGTSSNLVALAGGALADFIVDTPARVWIMHPQ